MPAEVAQMDVAGRLTVAIRRIKRAVDLLEEIRDIEPGSRGAYGKFTEAQAIAAEALHALDPDNFDMPKRKR